MLRKTQEDKVIHGVDISKVACNIFHLFFVDCSFIFCNVNLDDMRIIQNFLEHYCEVSRQVVNFNKSVVMLKGVCRKRCKSIVSIFEVGEYNWVCVHTKLRQ